MTETVLKEIVHRAVQDGSFRAQLRSDPAKALAGFSLTADERAALTSGDPTRLSALGIDQRMSKAFASGVLGDVSKAVIVTDTSGGSAAFIDEGSSAGSAVIVGDPAAAAPATIVQDIQSLSDLHMKLNEQDLNAGASLESPAGDPFSSHVRQLEQDLDAGSSLEAPADATGSSHLRQLEQDLDTGATVTPDLAPSEGTQVDIVDQPTDY